MQTMNNLDVVQPNVDWYQIFYETSPFSSRLHINFQLKNWLNSREKIRFVTRGKNLINPFRRIHNTIQKMLRDLL